MLSGCKTDVAEVCCERLNENKNFTLIWPQFMGAQKPLKIETEINKTQKEKKKKK